MIYFCFELNMWFSLKFLALLRLGKIILFKKLNILSIIKNFLAILYLMTLFLAYTAKVKLVLFTAK